jgi:hypothetical protein
VERGTKVLFSLLISAVGCVKTGGIKTRHTYIAALLHMADDMPLKVPSSQIRNQYEYFLPVKTKSSVPHGGGRLSRLSGTSPEKKVTSLFMRGHSDHNIIRNDNTSSSLTSI